MTYAEAIISILMKNIYNPSVSFADSSLYTREPQLCQ